MKIITQLECGLLIFLTAGFTSSAILNSRKTIMTSSGPVQGTRIRFNGRKAWQYLGIPFAQPPVGEHRFKKPRPVEKQSRTIKADKMPPACIQYSGYTYPWNDLQDGKSEDCLYLNIWVPQLLPFRKHSQKIPVMFWIYGGSFIVGSNRKRTYEGQALAVEGEVVVVTINYRLGVFGFLTSGTETAPRNVGLYDQLEALKWVNKNIGAFGGDPNQVTLVGESAGSISISLLCVSPLTKGLFHRVIMESGSAAYLLTEDNTASIATSQKVAEAVGCAGENTNIYDDPKEVVSCLRKVDAFKLAKTFLSFPPTSLLPQTSLFPSFGDAILPENARIALIKGDFHNVDVLIGNNHDEGSYMLATGQPEVFGIFGEKDPKMNKSHGETLLRDSFKDFQNTEGVIKHYLGSVSDSNYDEIRYQVYTALGDFSLLCPTNYFAERYSQAGNKVFYYFFVHRPSTTPWTKWMGVVHYEEVQFVFGVPQQEPKNYTQEEVRLGRKMVKIWTNFVKYGNPKYPWPLYSKENPIYFKLKTGLVPEYGRGPHEDNCDFFREYFGFIK